MITVQVSIFTKYKTWHYQTAKDLIEIPIFNSEKKRKKTTGLKIEHLASSGSLQ